MKKVVLASFLACASIVSGVPSMFGQDSASGAQAAPGPGGKVEMSAAEYAVYNNAMTQTTPQTKASGLEAYLVQFPQSAVKEAVLESIMVLDFSVDQAKAMDAADRLLQVNPENLKGLYVEVLLRRGAAEALTDATAKQSAMDTVAGYAQKALTAPKPKDMSEDDFGKLKGAQYPTFYSAIGYDALLKKDSVTAVDAYQKELAMVPPDTTKVVGPPLQDTYYLGLSYMQATPPDYLNCAFYTVRFVSLAPEPYKTQFAPTAKYCYKKYHGAEDGYDAVVAAATASLKPPADFATSVKPAPTPAERIHTIISTTTDLATLAIDDKETIFQNGSPEDAAKVWDTIKGKSVEIPDAVVIESSPTAIKVAVSTDAVQNKTADFTFNLTPVDDSKLTAAAAKKKADATAVGSKVTLTGTYDSFTPNPLMITMKDGAVVLKAAAKTAAKPAAGAHHPAAHKK